jgi:predicted nucleotidyltransferase
MMGGVQDCGSFEEERSQMKRLSSWTNKGSDVELLRRCKEAVRKVAADAEVILYGSRARGDAGKGSDYDILVVVNEPADMAMEETILDSVYPLELESGQVLTLMVYNRQKWESPLCRAMPFHKNVEREGVLL